MAAENGTAPAVRMDNVSHRYQLGDARSDPWRWRGSGAARRGVPCPNKAWIRLVESCSNADAVGVVYGSTGGAPGISFATARRVEVSVSVI